MNYNKTYSVETNNKGFLSGKVVGEPKCTHQIEGENFYEITLSVERRSEVADNIPVTISERLIEARNIDLTEGNTLSLKGEFRSFNKLENNHSKLVLYFFVKDILSEEEKMFLGENVNQVILTGFICKPPVYRQTPFKREICDILLAVNRQNFKKSDYLPCILWGRNARYMEKQEIGTKITITGRIQSREYTKTHEDGTIETKTAYEISCNTVELFEQQENEESNKSNAENPLQMLSQNVEENKTTKLA